MESQILIYILTNKPSVLVIPGIKRGYMYVDYIVRLIDTDK